MEASSLLPPAPLRGARNAVNKVDSENHSGSSVASSGSFESTTANSKTTEMSLATGTNCTAADSIVNAKPPTPQPALKLTEHPMHSRTPLNPMHNAAFVPSPFTHQNQMYQQQHNQQQVDLNHIQYKQFYRQGQFSHNESSVSFGNNTTSYCNENSGMLSNYKREFLDSHSVMQNYDNGGRTPNVSGITSATGNENVSASTSAVMSPRVDSSNSPTSTSSNLQASGLIGGGNPDFQCKKCGIILTKESELLEHISNIHGESPYASSGYSSSPYIKEEKLSAPMEQMQQQQQRGGTNADEILDLDSQKMIYSTQHMPSMLMHPIDPLYSMHNMQQRPMEAWNKSQNLPENDVYSQQQQQQQQQQQLQPHEQPNQLQYHASIKQEYPLVKTECVDSQNFANSFDPIVAGSKMSSQSQQSPQQQMMPHSPAEFPSTTTGSQGQQLQPAFNEVEDPSSSSALSATATTPRAANWKSNEARRPKTYNCSACNKWFTSSGHLKRHYNTTLHKNAVKSSGQPDPATLPISMFHHPDRDPNAKLSRRSNAKSSKAATFPKQQQKETPVPVPLLPEEVGTEQMIGYSGSSSPLKQEPLQQEPLQVNGMPYAQAQTGGYSQEYMDQVQPTSNTTSNNISAATTTPTSNTTVLNGHPNGLAGPSAQLITSPIPSSQTRGLLNPTSPPAITTSTIITKTEFIKYNQEQQLQQLLPVDETLEIFPEMKMMPERTVELHQLQAYNQPELPYLQREPVDIKLSPSTIYSQQYQDQLLEMPTRGNTFIYTTPPPPPSPPPQLQILTTNIMKPQQQQQQQLFNSPLDTSKPQLQQQHSNNMQLLPEPIMSLPNTFITNMDKTHMEGHQHHHQQLPGEDQEYQILSNSPVHNTNILPTTTNFPLHTLTTQQHITQCQQLDQQLTDKLQQGLIYVNTHNTIGSNNETVASSNPYTTQYIGAPSSSFGYQNIDEETTQQLFAVQQSLNEVLIPFTSSETSTKDHLPPAETLLQLRYASGTNLTSDQSSNSPPTTSIENYYTYPNSHTDSDSSGFVDTPSEIKLEDSAFSTEKVARSKKSTKKLKPLVSRIKQENRKSRISPSITPKRIRSNSPTSMSAGEKLPDGRIKCKMCPKITSGECYFQQHFNTKHRMELVYRCPKCGKNHASEDILKTHLKNHDEEGKKFKCTYCTKTYARKPDLTRHIHWIHEKNKEQHTCPICKKHFSRNDHMIKHMLIHSRDRKSVKQAKRSKGVIRSKGNFKLMKITKADIISLLPSEI